MIKDVVGLDYCRSCEVCQKRPPITFRDRVPIEGGVVSVEPVFSHFYVDALGPLFNHKVEYNYHIVHCVPEKNVHLFIFQITVKN